MDTPRERIAQIVKELRKKEGKTLEEFGAEFGVSYMAVSKWEKGDSMPTGDNFARLAAKAGFTVPEFEKYIKGKYIKPDPVDEVLAKMRYWDRSEIKRVAEQAIQLLAG